MNYPKLVWITIDAPRDVQEAQFEGTLDEATDYLQEKANHHQNFFGQVLHSDGLIHANIVPKR